MGRGLHPEASAKHTKRLEARKTKRLVLLTPAVIRDKRLRILTLEAMINLEVPARSSRLPNLDDYDVGWILEDRKSYSVWTINGFQLPLRFCSFGGYNAYTR